MPRDKYTLTSGQWENLGSILSDYLWDREEARSLIDEYLTECGVPTSRTPVLFDEVFQRVEVGFQRKGGK